MQLQLKVTDRAVTFRKAHQAPARPWQLHICQAHTINVYRYPSIWNTISPSTLVSLSLRLKDLLGPVTRVKKKRSNKPVKNGLGLSLFPGGRLEKRLSCSFLFRQRSLGRHGRLCLIYVWVYTCGNIYVWACTDIRSTYISREGGWLCRD